MSSIQWAIFKKDVAPGAAVANTTTLMFNYQLAMMKTDLNASMVIVLDNLEGMPGVV